MVQVQKRGDSGLLFLFYVACRGVIAGAAFGQKITTARMFPVHVGAAARPKRLSRLVEDAEPRLLVELPKMVLRYLEIET